MSHFKENIIIQFCGLPGVGKSTLATKMFSIINDSQLLSVRNIRRNLGHTTYLPHKNEAVFRALYSEMSTAMSRNQDIIIDSNETVRARRIYTAQLALANGYNLLNIECYCSEVVAKNRIMTREQVVDGLFEDSSDPGVYDILKERWQPIDKSELNLSNYYFVQIDTEKGKIKYLKTTNTINALLEKLLSEHGTLK